jgi:hypothetical protein
MDETDTSQRRIVRSFDVDLDFADRDQALKHFVHIPASQYREDKLVKHNTGVYFTEIPLNPVLGIAALDYKTAEARGYFKVDCLNVSVYKLIQSQDHYDQMFEKTPPWHRLCTDAVWTRKLIHVGNYYRLMESMKPNSVEKISAILAIIRPAKAHLQNQPWDRVLSEIWQPDAAQGYQFKKAHAYAYGHLVMLHMNLLDEVYPEIKEPF